MSIREQCKRDFTFNPEAPLRYNMLVGMFGFLAWNNAEKSDYAEMRSVLQEMIDAINETEEYENA